MESIWSWSDLVQLKAASTLELVKGDGLDSSSTVAILLVVDSRPRRFTYRQRRKYKLLDKHTQLEVDMISIQMENNQILHISTSLIKPT